MCTRCAAGLSLPLLLLAEWCGLPGAGLALWLYGGAAAAAVALGLSLNEGWRRALAFWRLVGRMILQYRAAKWWGRQQGLDPTAIELRYEELHRRFAPRVIGLILELRGFYVKLGQVLSVIEIVPEAYKRELAVLQAKVPPKPLHEVHAMLEAGLGKPVSEVFAWLDDKPIGAASIGQVHRATLLNGKAVVVKVQYPEVRRLFEGDFAQIAMACYFWTPQAMGEMSELRSQFMAELDFRREARVMAQVASNLSGPFPRIAVPRPHATLVSEHVLVMSELAGRSLLDGLKRMAQAYSEAQGISVDELKQQMQEPARGSADSAAAPGPSRLKLALLQGYVKTSTLVSNTGVALYNSSIGRVTAQPKKYQTAPPLINTEKTVKTLCAVLGHQVLRDGLFSSDPHPGNVLLLHDGRIGLIDFGQAKYLTAAQRLQVARTVVAVATGDEAAILGIARESRFRTQRNDADSLVRYTRLQWEGSLRELAHLAQSDPVEQTDGELVMVRRAVVLTRSVAAVMGSPVNMAREWVHIARAVLAEAGEEVSGGSGGSGGGAEEEQGVDAGDGVRVLLERAAEGKAEGKVEAVRVMAAAIGWQVHSLRRPTHPIHCVPLAA